MNRDMKIGLSLGVLLVGIVGALFFRREPEKKDAVPPQLQDAGKLDQLIAEKPHGPYITAPEDFAENTPAEAPRTTAKKSRPQAAYEVPEFLTKDDEAAQRNLLADGAATAPDPIQPPQGGRTAGTPRPPAPSHNQDWQTAGPPADRSVPTAPKSDANQPGAPSRTTPMVAKGRQHVIQAGDTLSTLAIHYLGSSARFREIYEANRDVLRSPDDLREGTTIAIPDQQQNIAAHPKARMASQTAEDGRASRATSHSNATDTQDSADDLDALPPTPRPRNRAATGPASQPAREEGASAGAAPAPQGPESTTPKSRFRPIRRTPFSAGRVPRAESFPVPTEEPAEQPSKERPASGLPHINVLESTDLLDSENEAFRPLTGTGTPAAGQPRSYKVQRGDTLERIALKLYGSRSKAGDILEANRQKLSLPEELREGMELVIP